MPSEWGSLFTEYFCTFLFSFVARKYWLLTSQNTRRTGVEQTGGCVCGIPLILNNYWNLISDDVKFLNQSAWVSDNFFCIVNSGLNSFRKTNSDVVSSAGTKDQSKRTACLPREHFSASMPGELWMYFHYIVPVILIYFIDIRSFQLMGV